MSSAELIAAADHLDALADAATPGPWAKVEHHGRDFTDEGYSYIYVGVAPLGREVASTYPPGREDDPCEENAAYIAAMHPGVAKAVAAWLRITADTTGCDCGVDEEALNLARALTPH